MKRKQQEDELVQMVEEGKQKKQKGMHNHGGDGVAWIRGELIGKGSFGSVYLTNSRRPRSRNGCLPPIMAVKSAEVSASGSIQKEREALGNIGRCPYVIRCFGDEITTGENGEMVYNLLLEYGSGGTLAALINKSGGRGLPESEVKLYTLSILRGLNHIHGCGYVHCDLKPENILLVQNPNPSGSGNKHKVKIGDFGLAKRAKLNKKKEKKKLHPYLRGTRMYLSPEAVVDGIQEPPSDIWALGCIVLEMLTGKPPWDGKQDLDADEFLRQIGESHEMPRIPSDVSRDCKEFLKGCFARKAMFRLTAEMLLNHSFLGGLIDDEVEIEEGQEILLTDMINSPLLLCDMDDDFGYSSFEDDCSFETGEELSCSSWLEGVEEIDSGEVSSFADNVSSQGYEEVSSNPEQVTDNSLQQGPLTFTIPAGV